MVAGAAALAAWPRLAQLQLFVVALSHSQLRSALQVFLHPASALHSTAPQWVVFSQLVQTEKRIYMSGASFLTLSGRPWQACCLLRPPAAAGCKAMRCTDLARHASVLAPVCCWLVCAEMVQAHEAVRLLQAVCRMQSATLLPEQLSCVQA